MSCTHYFFVSLSCVIVLFRLECINVNFRLECINRATTPANSELRGVAPGRIMFFLSKSNSMHFSPVFVVGVRSHLTHSLFVRIDRSWLLNKYTDDWPDHLLLFVNDFSMFYEMNIVYKIVDTNELRNENYLWNCRYQRVEIPVFVRRLPTMSSSNLQTFLDLPNILVQEENDAYEAVRR